MASPFKFGSEFLINSTTSGSQIDSSITGLADGRFVVSWTNGSATGGDTSGNAVRAQIFFADGTPSGTEFLVNTTTASDQSESEVTALADGRFVITWTDFSATGGDTRAQIFNADGAASGAEFLVNTTTSSTQDRPDITALADGGFVVTFSDISLSGADTEGRAVRAQVFNADGSPSGAEFLVNTTTAGSQHQPSITALVDGRFVVSWEDSSQTGGDTSNTAIRAQMFNADGSMSGAEFLVNTTTTDEQILPSITGLADGRFVVSWTDFSLTGGDTSGTAVRAQVFNTDGSPSGEEFLVNTTTANSEQDPSVTGLADGRFVVSWTDFITSGASFIRAQVFNIDGTKAEGQFFVTTTMSAGQIESSITALADGRFVVSWTDFSATGGDTSGAAIRGQIFDPRDSAVTLSGSTLDDDFVGTRFGDTIYGFIGDDNIIGRSGDDFLFGELGDDTLKGGSGNDRLYGGANDDILRGNGGADQLFGGDGDDNLSGGFGLDFMDGGAGNDVYTVDVIGDIVVEGAGVGSGTDLIRSGTIDLDLANYANVENLRLTGLADLDLTGNSGNNTLTGNDGENRITGKGGADRIDGREGDDILLGNGGADQLTGGMGRDKLTGGSNADQFIFNDASETGVTGATRDTITDFSQAQGDLIDLSGIDAGSGGGDQAFTFIGSTGFTNTEGELRFNQTATKTIVQGDIDGDGIRDFTIELTGVIALTAGDFVL